MSFIAGQYIEHPDIARDGMVPLSWKEYKLDLADVSSLSEQDEVYVIVYCKNKISPLCKIWVPSYTVNDQTIPAVYPRPRSYPETYKGNRVLSYLRHPNNGAQFAYMSKFPDNKEGKGTWTGHGIDWNEEISLVRYDR